MARKVLRNVPKRKKKGVKIRIHLTLNPKMVEMLDVIMDYYGWKGSRDSFVREYALDLNEFFSSHIPDMASEDYPVSAELVALAESLPSFSERFRA